MSTATKKPGKSLVPAKGTNPDKFPVPRAPLLDFFIREGQVFPELCYITSQAVGHGVGIYYFLGSIKGGIESKDTKFQVMKWTEGPGPGQEFWKYQLWERPQWYDTPEQACAAYVASHAQWLKEHPDQPQG